MPRTISDTALAKIKEWEGLILYAYDDLDPQRPPRRIMPDDPVRGMLTIGYGHTGTARPGLEINERHAAALLRRDLRTAEAAVERLVEVPLNDNQFGALVSFCFNVGAGAFSTSTLLRRLNAGEYEAVPEELARWVYSGIKKLTGLVRRRREEGRLWNARPTHCNL